jgi:hypothetical protein
VTNPRKPARSRRPADRKPELSSETTNEATNTAALLTSAKQALEQFLDVQVDDDGALTFQHAGVPGAVSAVQLAEGLVVLSMTCVVAWDVPAEPAEPAESTEPAEPDSAAVGDVAARLALRAGEGLFGTLGAVRTERGYDVTLRYAFPAAGLEPTPLGTLLMLVISTASQLRSELLTT